VLIEILSRPEDWATTADAMAVTARRDRGKRGEGRDKMRGAFAELDACGYLVRVQTNVGRGRIRTELHFYDVPAGHTDDGAEGTSVLPGQTDVSAGGTDDASSRRRSADSEPASPQVAPTTAYQSSVHQSSVDQASLRTQKTNIPPSPPTPLRRERVAGARAGEGKPSPTAKDFQAFVEEIHAARGWPRADIRRHMDTAVAKRGWSLARAAMRLLAADPATYSPGRLVKPGPWWALAKAQLAREDIPEWCGQCGGPEPARRWIGNEDHPTKCPNCHPSVRTREVA
jgi:hypothetical protein